MLHDPSYSVNPFASKVLRLLRALRVAAFMATVIATLLAAEASAHADPCDDIAKAGVTPIPALSCAKLQAGLKETQRVCSGRLAELQAVIDTYRTWLRIRECARACTSGQDAETEINSARDVAALALAWARTCDKNDRALKQSVQKALSNLGACKDATPAASADAADAARQAQLLLLCKDLSPDTRKRLTSLVPSSTPKLPLDLEKLRTGAKASIEALRQCRSQSVEAGAQAPDCSSLERAELAAVTTYLTAIHVEGLPGNELAQAIELLFGLGIDRASVLDLERATAAHWLQDPALAALVGSLSERPKIRELLKAAAGKPIDFLIAELKKLPADEQQKFFLDAGAVFMARLRGAASKEQSQRLLDLIISPVPPSDCERGMQHFLTHVQNVLAPVLAPGFPVTVPSANYLARIEEQQAKRRAGCGATGTGSGECGATLGIQFATSGDRATGHAVLTFTIPNTQPAGSPPKPATRIPIEVEDFSVGCKSEAAQTDAARKFVADVFASLNVLYALPGVENAQPPVSEAVECGITLGRKPHQTLTLAARGGVDVFTEGVRPAPRAGAEAPSLRGFSDGLRGALAEYEGWTGGIRAEAQSKTRVTFEQERQAEFTKLNAHVHVREESASGEHAWTPAFTVWAQVATGKCNASPELQSKQAGALVGREIGNIFFGIGSQRAPRSPPPLWHGALLAGTRQLEYYGPGSAWKYGAIADAALFIGGTALILSAVPAANRAIARDGTSASANARLWSGLGLTGIALGIRVVGFFDSLEIRGPQE